VTYIKYFCRLQCFKSCEYLLTEVLFIYLLDCDITVILIYFLKITWITWVLLCGEPMTSRWHENISVDCTVLQNTKRSKVQTFIYCHLQVDQNSSSLLIEVVYWSALAVGIVAQLLVAHCWMNTLLTHSLQLDKIHLGPSQPHYALHRFTCNVLRQWLTIFSSGYFRVLIATHLPTPEGWKAELAWAPQV